MMPVPLCCPLCRSPLQAERARYVCPQGHSFDIAREGYVNLLPVQRKRSRQPGDSAEMLLARRRFLDSGAYAPLVDALLNSLQDSACRHVLDAGCGEGYYLHELFERLPGERDFLGLDIAKPAVRAAARRNPAIRWLVASAADVPLPAGALDAVLCVFARLEAAEFARLLRDDGHLLLVVPGPDHLLGLRQAIYEQVRPHREGRFHDDCAPFFELLETQSVRFSFSLDDEARLDDLLQMTPYAWRLTEQARQRLVSGLPLSMTADFRLHHYRRRPRDGEV